MPKPGRSFVDYETQAIEDRPRYPPEPAGVAVTLPGQPKKYYAWGHPTQNGIWELRGKRVVKREGDPKRLAKVAVREAYTHEEVGGWNSAKFDADVSETHMGVKGPPWHRVRDGLFSRFLADPHAQTLSLKPCAERVLGIAPGQRDAVYDWLADHNIIQGAKNGKYPRSAGASITKAPGDLVGLYAIQDNDLADKMTRVDEKYVKANGMWEAYQRELRVAPILLTNERAGMRVNTDLLERDQKLYRKAIEKVEAWLRKKLGAPASINFNSDAEVAFALKKSGQVKVFPKTPTGKDSVSSKRLTKEFFLDPDVYRALTYRGIVDYVLSHNIDPWLVQASLSGNRVFTQWQQVRSDSEYGGGARSGRVTCSGWAAIIKDPTGGKNPDYLVDDDLRIRALVGLPELPLARKYCLPDEGELFGHADWNQQEIRLTANYEDAQLAEAYKTNPAVDIHQFCTGLINKNSGQKYVRGVIKHVNLRQFYGGGRAGLVTHPMLRLDKVYGCDLDCHHQEDNCEAYLAAGRVIKDWRAGLPGVVSLTNRLKAMYERGEAIRTLGGRLYNCKPPGVATKGPRKGQWVEFSYTALNYLIQPSGADACKMALIAYDEHPKRKARLLNLVYDEINISTPKKIAKGQLGVLTECLMSVKIDVPWKVDSDLRINWKEKIK